MRIDLPFCDFRFCQFEADGNCITSESKREGCRYLEKQLTNGWISVSERLPEEGRIVLVTDGMKYQSIYCVALKIADEWRVSWNHDRFGIIDIVAWQPLPEPFKEETVNDKID